MEKSVFCYPIEQLFGEFAAFLFYFLEWFHVALLVVVLQSKQDPSAKLFTGYGFIATIFDIFLNSALYICFPVPVLVAVKAKQTDFLTPVIRISVLLPPLTAFLYILICLSSGVTWYSMVSMTMALVSTYRVRLVTKWTNIAVKYGSNQAKGTNKKVKKISKCSNTGVSVPREAPRSNSLRSSPATLSTSTNKTHFKSSKSLKSFFRSILSKSKTNFKSNASPYSKFSSANNTKVDSSHLDNYANNKFAPPPPDNPPSYASATGL